MDPKLRMSLSPVAFATLLALAGAQSVLPVPWFAPGTAEANHCAPPCDCVCACDCVACDTCVSCCADPDDELN